MKLRKFHDWLDRNLVKYVLQPLLECNGWVLFVMGILTGALLRVPAPLWLYTGLALAGTFLYAMTIGLEYADKKSRQELKKILDDFDSARSKGRN